MAVNFFNDLLARRQEARARKIQRRNIRDANNPFEIPDREFQKIFRYSKPMIIYLCEELGAQLQPANAVDGLPVHLKVLSSVRLLGNGSYQRPTGQDHSLCIAQTTVSKYLTQFTAAIYNILFPRWIHFPGNEQERRATAEGFRAKHGVPDVVGALDCTHVAIFPPKKPQGIQFRNRKGVYSINTQLVCDVNGRIIHINARFPGRVHDQFIFNQSNIKREMKRLYEQRIGSYYLLGDSGYALEPWLMTPVLNAAPDSPDDKYTKWHCQARNVVERANGYLKGTFRCLGHDRVLHYSPEKASEIIYACATLYNIMLHYRIPLEDEAAAAAEDDLLPPRANIGQIPAVLLRLAEDKRQQIINTHFL